MSSTCAWRFKRNCRASELERQFKAALFERSVTQPAKVAAVLRQTHPAALEVFRDAYMVEFLGLPGRHAEADLLQGLLARLNEFLIELGRDFCFVGSEYPLQVGGRDFALDLLFFHRGLNCLVAIEAGADSYRNILLASPRTGPRLHKTAAQVLQATGTPSAPHR